MELDQMRYFLVLCEELHFGRAGLRVRLAQSALSQQILRLERELGVALFERHSRQVRLTAAGRAFQPHARRLIVQAEQTLTAGRRAASGRLGQVRIGLSWGVPRRRLADALAACGTGAHELEPCLLSVPDGEQQYFLARGDVDMAWVWLPCTADTIATAELQAVPWQLHGVGPPGGRGVSSSSISLSRLVGQRLLVADLGSATADILARLTESGCAAMHCDVVRSEVEADVMSHSGSAYVLAPAQTVHGGDWCAAVPELPPAVRALAWRPHALSPQARRLLSHLVQREPVGERRESPHQIESMETGADGPQGL